MDGKSVTAVYASTSGHTEAVVEYLAQVWQAQDIETKLARAEKSDVSVFAQGTHFLIATSTWEHGVLNPFFQALSKEMKSADFSGKKALFVGLGDTRYEPVYFCQGIEIMKEIWMDAHGAAVGTMLKINGEPFQQFETILKPWSEQQLPLFFNS
jgi:flavodoxin